MNRFFQAAFVFCSVIGFSFEAHSQAMDHSHHQAGPVDSAPIEPGQSAFAAIAEIVAILNADPGTDWDRVNINALRMHLIDMDELTRNAQISTQRSDDSVIFSATGPHRTMQALKNMVPAHASVLDDETAWNASAEVEEDVVRIVLRSEDQRELTKIEALGFFGLMATGAHHQEHHLAIARGEPMH